MNCCFDVRKKSPMKLSFLLQLLARFRQQAFQVSVILVLMAIGVWGHHSHWQFSPHARANVAARRHHLPATDPTLEVGFPCAGLR